MAVYFPIRPALYTLTLVLPTTWTLLDIISLDLGKRALKMNVTVNRYLKTATVVISVIRLICISNLHTARLSLIQHYGNGAWTTRTGFQVVSVYGCTALVYLDLFFNFLTAVGIRCADHATPSTSKKLALTSPTSGGRSVGIVHLRTKDMEFIFNIYREGRPPWNGISPSQGPYLHTEQHKRRINSYRHQCLEWDSYLRCQCSSGRRWFSRCNRLSSRMGPRI
jgi:hypothetical protein